MEHEGDADPIVIVALETVSKDLEERQDEFEIRGKIETTQAALCVRTHQSKYIRKLKNKKTWKLKLKNEAP